MALIQRVHCYEDKELNVDMEADPLSLEELCLDKYVSMLEPCTRLLYSENPSASVVSLSKLWWKDKYYFAEFLAELLIKKMKLRGQCNDALMYLFSDVSSCRIRRANLSKSDVTDNGLERLSCQRLIELNVSGCKKLSLSGLTRFLSCQPSLIVLRMSNMEFDDGECFAFKYFQLNSLKNLQELNVSFSKLPLAFLRDTIGNMTKMVHLNLEGCYYPQQDSDRDQSFNVADFLETGEQCLSNIVDLDLGGHTVSCLNPLMKLKGTVTRLTLYNCNVDLDMIMEVVTQLDNLQVLDISKEEEPNNVDFRWKVGNNDLKSLSTLPKLTNLDLSVVADFGESAMEDLRKRPTKLKFLGLAQTMTCHYQDIPAEVVTGNCGERQVVATIRKYKKRPKYIVKAIADLAELLGDHMIQDVCAVIEVVIQAVEALVENSDVVMNGSILLYRLTSDEHTSIAPVCSQLLNLIVLLMEAFSHNPQIQRTCCIILCNLKIPRDVDSHMQRIVHLLIQMTINHEDQQSQRIAVTLLNFCVCHISLKQKEMWGLQTIQIMLKIIKRELDCNKTGLILNQAWSTLWNITDETPVNSNIFIENDGLVSFNRCISHHNDVELIRNVLGMIGNVAEVVELHPRLMASNIVQPIYNLLLNEGADLETRYNVCGIICHLAGCDENAWTLCEPTRDEALHKVEQEIESWDVTCHRQMSYISFKPLLRLLQSSYPSQTHYWVVWALRNFCHYDPKKYPGLVIRDGGLPLLERLAQDPSTKEHVAVLASSILDVCNPPSPL